MLFFRKTILLTFPFFLFTISISAQEIKKGEVYSYARKIVDTMTSESMHGRGYVNGGDSIAANYLKTEFKKFGLKSFTDESYYQKMSFAVNVFDQASLKIDGKLLVPGKDFIPFHLDPSASGKYPVVIADDNLVSKKKKLKKFRKQDFDNKILLINDEGEKTPELQSLPWKSKAIITIKDKLTWSVGQKQQDVVLFEVLRSSYIGAKEIEYSVVSHINKNHASQNVIGYIKGSVHPDSFIVYTAHYDHLGQMGKDVYFPGANDNASGCAMLLNLAKYYSQPENKPKYSIVFMAFCGEEVGLLGSKYYNEHPLFPMKNIRFLLNMDIMGTGEDGITVVNGSVFKTEFDKLKEINTKNNFIKDVKIRGKAANSDHYFFAENGVKACFIYTMGGIKAYHDIYDRGETLPLNEFENLFKLITTFGEYLQE
ncbi:hypothetical protein BH10BAC1_BH10BAC1_01750 [soil metagenome]